MGDGTPVVVLDGSARPLAIHGVEVPRPVPRLYIEILTHRMRALSTPLRCEIIRNEGSERAVFRYLAWQDKSGDVWVDLATTLLEEGVVKVEPTDFPQRAEYLRSEAEAQRRKAGVWSGSGDER
jgi:hypothetical protein